MTDGLAQLNSLFLHAVDHGNIDRAQQYLELGADLDATTESQDRGALHIAVQKNNLPMAMFLVRNHIELDAGDHEDDRPIHIAASTNLPRMVHFIKSVGGKVDIPNMIGTRPIWDALWGGQYESFSALLDVGGYESEYRDKGNGFSHRKVRERSLVDHEILLNEYDRVATRIDNPVEGEPLRDYLLKRDGNHRIPFQSAAAWQQLPKVLEQCEKEGHPLAREDFAMALPGNKSLLQRAAECHQFTAVADYLSARGEKLGRDVFMDTVTKEATPLIDTLIQTCQLQAGLEVARQTSRDSSFLRGLVQAIPESDRQVQLPNAHSLFAQATRNAQPARSR